MALTGGSIIDAQGNALTSQLNGTQQSLDVGVNVAGVQVDPRETRPLAPNTDQVDVRNITGTVPLPTGAATSAKQDTGNLSLTSIDGKLNTLGQKAATGSVPVVLASDQSAVPVLVTIPSGALTDASGTVGTSSSSILAANPSRKYLLIQNVSINKLYINFGAAATTGAGSVFLAASGGSLLMENQFICTQQIFGISDKANTGVTIKYA